MNFKFILLSLVLCLFISTGCNKTGSSSGIAVDQDSSTPEVPVDPPAETPVDPTDDADSAVCAESEIDAGMKGPVSVRGSISDVAINPVSDYPVTAYFDNSALSVKLSYWNGIKYIHETIAGAPAVNNISLTVLSTGIPVLAWTNGGVNVFLASRSVALSTGTASWNTRMLLNTATASRGIKIQKTPTDMVGGAYLSDTAATGRPRLLLCTSTCDDLSNYQTMTTANNIGNETTTILAAQTRVGFAWCGADTGGSSDIDAYYPIVTYARSATSPRVTSCPSANAASCLTGASWTTNAQYVTGSVLNSTLQIDPTVANDSVKIAAFKTGAGIKTYVSGSYASPVGCQTNFTTFDESAQTVGGTTIGNTFLDFLRDSSGKFHLIANSALTAMNYYNSASPLLSSMDVLTSWNAAHTLNTALATVAVTVQGGAAITTDGKIYSTHFLNFAATKFNLIMNLITDPSISSAATASQNNFVNTEGHISLTASNTSNISLAEADDGTMAVAYVDFSAGARATGVLKYSYRNGSELASAWEVVNINGTTGALSPKLKFDHLSRPWISFYDDVSARFYLAYNERTNGSAIWQFFVFPASPTGAAVLPATPDTGLMMYENAGTKTPVMVILDNVNTASKGVKSAKFNSSTFSWSNLVTIDGLGTGTASNLSSTFDENGNLVVTYLDRTVGAANYTKYSSSTNGATSWSAPLVVGTVAMAGQGMIATINPYSSTPMIIYHDRATNRLYRSTCSGTVSGCQTTGWSTSVLDFATGLSSLTITATGTEGLIATAVGFKVDGSYDILYPKGPADTGNLQRIKLDDEGNIISTASFYSSVSSSLSTTAALNFGMAGFNVSALVNSTGQIVSVFGGPGNKIFHKSCDTLRE